MMLYLTLFYEFFKTGLFAVGGGLATLPFLRAMAEKHPEWFSIEELGNMVAIANSAPGPIGINVSTYAGYTVGGVLGAIIAVTALVLPAFIVIMIVVRVLDRFMENKIVQEAFTGIRPAVNAMIAVAGIEIVKISIVDTDKLFSGDPVSAVSWISLFFAAVMFMIVRKTKLPIISYIAVGAAFGIIVGL